MNRTVGAVLATAVVSAAACIGCGGSEETGDGDDNASTSEESDTIRIAWIPKEKGNEVFQVGLDGAELKALELSQTTDKTVEIVYLAPQSASDIQGQMDSVQEAIDMGVDAIAISCSAPEVSEMVDRAIEAGIPTMAWDSDCRHPSGEASKRFTYFGIDNRATGHVAARLTQAVLANDGNMEPPYEIGILSGIPVATNLQERVAGVWDELKEMDTCRFNENADGEWELDRCWPDSLAPEDAQFHIYGDEPEKCQNTWDAESCATIYAEVETEDSGETLEEVSLRDRNGDGQADLDAVILIGLWPLFAYDENPDVNAIGDWTDAMRAGSLHTISYDTLQFQIDMARDGLIDAMVGQKYWGWGFDVVQMVYDHLESGAEYDPDFTNSGEDIVCPNNFAEMDNMWSSGDFTQVLPACELLE